MSINPSSTGMIRIDSSRNAEYLYAERPKLNFFQKVGRFMGKAMKFLGPIGAAVTAVALPGVGLPIAAGLYGLSNVAGHLTDKAESKDAMKMNEWMADKGKQQIMLPGLFEQSTQADIQTSFITPQEMQPQVTMTIVDREMYF